jgi:hypothetical protein
MSIRCNNLMHLMIPVLMLNVYTAIVSMTFHCCEIRLNALNNKNKIARCYKVEGAVPRFASMVTTWRGLFRVSVTLTPDIEFASPITFFGWASWSILSPARVPHSSIPQLPCVAVPSSPSGSFNPHLLHNIISWRRHLQKPSQKLRKLLPAPTRRPRCTRGNPPQPGFWVQVIERAQL